MTHQQLKSFAHSKKFCSFVNYAIISFAVLVGLETVIKNEDWQLTIRVIDYFYLAFFTFEIILRIAAEDHPGLYFVLFRFQKVTTPEGVTKTQIEFTEHGFWNYFDFALIALSLFGLVVHLFIRPGFIQIGRLFRIFRIIRLLEISEHLKQIEQRILSIIPTVFSFAVLLLILNYIYAVLGMFMFGGRQFSTCDFSTMLSSFVTLFQIMTLDNWSDVMHDLATNSQFHPFIIQAYFVSFVIFTSIIAFNVFVAVMTSQVQSKMEADIKQKAEEHNIAESNTQDLVRESMKEVLDEIQILKKEIGELKKGR